MGKNRSAKNRSNLRAAKNVKAKRSASAELEQIENLLGEEFESLSEARKAIKQQTGPRPNQKSYTVSQLSTKSHRTVGTFVSDLEDHSAEIDALKQPTQFWAAKIYGHKTYNVYSNINELARKLASYRGLQEEHPQAALKNIEIIRVDGVDASKYHEQKQKEKEKSWAKAKKKHKLDRKRQRREKAKLKAAQKKLALQKKLISKLQRQLKKKK